MEVQRMRTFITLMPGERRSCIGCHEPRTQAPVSRMTAAYKPPPRRALSAQPGGTAPRPLHYPTDVQPILDRHCVSCHNGKDPKAAPDLRGDMTQMFCRSYEAIFKGGLVDTIQEWNGADHAMANVETVPPYSHGSHRSKLVELLKKGHYDVDLSREEWIKLGHVDRLRRPVLRLVLRPPESHLPRRPPISAPFPPSRRRAAFSPTSPHHRSPSPSPPNFSPGGRSTRRTAPP